ncbi:MAG: peptide-methionine (S)-S-oxide reductase MsrA [Planctomycetota bacterium]
MSEKAYFAGGCFWGIEHAFRQVPGVIDAISGYMGGHVENPTYEQVCSKTTGHAEAVEVEFDPAKVGFEQLMDTFFSIHKPTELNRQGPDIGSQYRSAIFPADDAQRAAAEARIKAEDASGKWDKPVVTAIEPMAVFYKAEEYHQRYFEKTGRMSCSI